MQNVKKLISAVLTLAIVVAMTLSATAFAAVEDTGYSDVDASNPYAEAILYCQEHNLMDGVGEGRFDPDGSLTRAALATVLYRMEGEPTVTGDDGFTDTADGQWYSDAILWASQQELMGGYGGGIFGTNDSVTRQDMTTILGRYAGSRSAENADDFEDESAISNYAVTAVDWASANGIVAPVSEGRFAPRENASRAQIAAALMNFCLNVQTGQEPSGETKVLVVYFSATNTTKPLAGYIADGLGADIYEIVPATPYTSADLNYGNSSSRTSIEMNDPNARPDISGSVNNIEQYDVIFLGYPIWWGQAPRIIGTFLESYDFSGKTIVPFCTSGSSDIGSSATNLHNLTSGANWLDGRRFGGGTSRGTIIEWVNSLGLDVTAE